MVGTKSGGLRWRSSGPSFGNNNYKSTVIQLVRNYRMKYATKFRLNYKNHTGKLRASGTESNGFPEIGGGRCIGTALDSSEVGRSNLNGDDLSDAQTRVTRLLTAKTPASSDELL